MIRTTTKLSAKELESVLSIWLHANLDSHEFIPSTYWENQVESVRKALPDAVIYLAEIDQEIIGFAGVIDQFIAGIFVKREYRQQRIGTQLMKKIKETNKDLKKANKKIKEMKESTSWKIGRAITCPVRKLKTILRKFSNGIA